MRFPVLFISILTILCLTACEDSSDLLDQSNRFIIAARYKEETQHCQALSHENVLWNLQHIPLHLFIQQLQQHEVVPRQIQLQQETRLELEKTLSVNESEATILQRRPKDLFNHLTQQINQLDTDLEFGTHALPDRPDTLVIAIDLSSGSATIVHISQLTINGQRAAPPQPLVDETLQALQLTP